MFCQAAVPSFSAKLSCQTVLLMDKYAYVSHAFNTTFTTFTVFTRFSHTFYCALESYSLRSFKTLGLEEDGANRV